VLAPSLAAARDWSGGSLVNPGQYAELLAGIRGLRGSGAVDPRDDEAWHLVGADSGGRVVGAIRVRVYDLADDRPPPVALFDFAGVRIPDAASRSAVEAALAEYMAAARGRCSAFYQIGGFVVAPAYRGGSGLAPMLALAVNAWVEVLRLHAGCTFAAVEGNVAKLDQKLGAFSLGTGGGLPRFYCAVHRADFRLLGTEPGRYEPRLAPTVAALVTCLRESPVVVASESAPCSIE
jgi:hypothetical protein